MFREHHCYMVDGDDGLYHVYSGPKNSLYGHHKIASFLKKSSAVKFIMRRGRHNMDIVMNSTPEQREMGTSSLTNLYKKSTPGQ